ncbi:MAG: TetR/AcrR family transcriptional regulator [Bacteroides sp.]|nr:TetR/AcrR family transcriptional regulator [Bacteroides sp.]
MIKDRLTPEAYATLLDSISNILLSNGIKATSMDFIASSLHISKRTLYEVFDSKSSMVSESLKALHQRMCHEHTQIFESSENVMEAILLNFIKHRDFLSKTNVDFLRDIDYHFAEAKIHSEDSKQLFIDNFVAMLQKGVEQGYFREDVNLHVQCRMMLIQMESLKRMEEFFPPDITLLDVYDSVNISFLRGICSLKGMEMLDSLTSKLFDKNITDK